MQLILHEFALPLRHVFAISRAAVAVQPTLVVELRDGNLSGFGEATSDEYYGVTIDGMKQVLSESRSEIENAIWSHPSEFWTSMAPRLRSSPFAQCALDMAAYDLWGKQRGEPTWKLLGLDVSKTPPSNYTIGIAPIDEMVAKLNEFPDWPVYKIKLGTKHDMEIVRALRTETRAPFRVDANCGWTAPETIDNSRALKDLDVEFIEQPLPRYSGDEMTLVYRDSHLPVIADESCQVEEDIHDMSGRFHGVNIKVVKCGGMTPALRMIHQARSLGLKVMIGCMTESTVGISAIAQLAPLLDYVDLDGAALLAQDIATGVSVERGICHYPALPGHGVRLI